MQTNKSLKRGAYLALATALVSGISVYVNSYGVKQVADPFVFTTAKNLLVGFALAGLALLPVVWGELRRLSRRQWLSLAVLGLIGGSTPFLLFFYGLAQATAPSAAFIHKTLFLWVAILAVPFLKERPGKLQLAALVTLVVGHLVLVGRPARWAVSHAELLVLSATLLWAVEAIVARRVLGGVSVAVAAFGRMGFGSLAMLGFLATTGRLDGLGSMSGGQWSWVLVTSILLMAYVGGYYGALKHVPATLVTSILVLGSVVTSLLYAVFNSRTYAPEQVAGFALIGTAAALWLHIAHRGARGTSLNQEVAHARQAGR